MAADQLKVGAAVFGADGAKIGELNRVTSDASGKVEEIRVTTGDEAGLTAKVFAVPGDKITGVKDGVRLSLSSDEAKKSCRSSTTATASSDCWLPESETRPHSKIGTRPFHIVQSKRPTSRTFCT